MADAPGTDFVVVPASEGAVAHEHASPPLPPPDTEPRATIATRTTGSLSRRMILIAAGWILLLLTGGGFALDRVLTTAITQNFDDQLEYVLTALIVSAEIGPQGEVFNNRELADQRLSLIPH